MKSARNSNRKQGLRLYIVLTYLVLLINAAPYMKQMHYTGWLTPLFSVAVYLSYGALYMLPALILMGAVALMSSRKIFGRFLERPAWLRAGLLNTVAVTALGATQFLIFADKFLFRLYGFHMDNGFVWNLVTTPGGIDSLGSAASAQVTFAGIFLAFVLLQVVLLLVVRMDRWHPMRVLLRKKRVFVTALCLLLALALFQGIAYGICSFQGYSPVLVSTDAFPLYQPITFAHRLKALGYEATKTQAPDMRSETLSLHYPLNPIERDENAKHYNIVWLVAESLNRQMLDPEIMPATWAFAKDATRFDHHYSSGNGTRMGMFGMFYGLYGNYWFDFLREQRGPVVMDLLVEDDYQFELFTSAKFSYPELDRTLFARIDPEHMHETNIDLEWERDRENIAGMLNFLEKRDRDRPFMTFLFFESPHARYYFPPENAIRTPYLEELNYATMDLERDHELIRNRYINSSNHLDSQIARILDYLKKANLLDSTLVIITGDHGEEFMEKGHWGHNSAFTEEQTLVPFILWIPGRPGAVIEHMSSHLDVPATLLPLLGVTNPPEDYSLGYNLLGDRHREYTIISAWHKLAYVDATRKAVFPTKTAPLGLGYSITDNNDNPVPETDSFMQTHGPRLMQVMRDLKRFGNRPTSSDP